MSVTRTSNYLGTVGIRGPGGDISSDAWIYEHRNGTKDSPERITGHIMTSEGWVDRRSQSDTGRLVSAKDHEAIVDQVKKYYAMPPYEDTRKNMAAHSPELAALFLKKYGYTIMEAGVDLGLVEVTDD